jgi:uncharacterized protein HemX
MTTGKTERNGSMLHINIPTLIVVALITAGANFLTAWVQKPSFAQSQTLRSEQMIAGGKIERLEESCRNNDNNLHDLKTEIKSEIKEIRKDLEEIKILIRSK